MRWTTTAVLAVLLAAGISFALSQTIVLPALSVLGEQYGASATATSWIVTAYLLSASIATPITTIPAISIRISGRRPR